MAGNQWGPLDAAFRPWVAACIIGETLGMTAAALAARAPDSLGLAPAGTGSVLAFAFVILGGVIEGLALGILQALVLRKFLPHVRYKRWAVTTAVVAGLGWAGASAPAALSSGDAGGESPPLGLIVLGAAGIGAVMGAVLGAAQALVLRGAVIRPWRWILMSVAGWVPAMVVIFLGATAPSAVWPLVGVVALGTVTGVVAGATLGVVTGALLPLLDATSMGDRVALSVLRSPLHGLVDRSLVGLRVRGRHTGRLFELPVMYCRQGDSLLVFVGRSIDKRWWKNVGAATPLMVLLDGRWTWATASRLSQNDPGRDEAARSYFARWPMARRVATDADPIVRIALAGV